MKMKIQKWVREKQIEWAIAEHLKKYPKNENVLHPSMRTCPVLCRLMWSYEKYTYFNILLRCVYILLSCLFLIGVYSHFVYLPRSSSDKRGTTAHSISIFLSFPSPFFCLFLCFCFCTNYCKFVFPFVYFFNYTCFYCCNKIYGNML